MRLQIFAILAFINVISAYNVLVLAPLPGPSHWIMFQRYIKEMVQRGHTVTAITGIKMGAPISNYTEVFIDPPFDLQKLFNSEKIFETNFLSFEKKLMALMELGLATSAHGLQTTNVQKFINTDKSHFDVILAEQFFQESFLMFAHKYNAPIVTLNTYGCSDFMDRAMGLLTPISFVPHALTDYTDEMSFPERFMNAFVTISDIFVRRFHYIPAMEAMAKKHFQSLATDNGPLPSVTDLESSISVMLINSHRALFKPRPFMPGMIDVGGSHIKPVSPLPQDLQEFLDNATDGVIYFSIGAYMKSAKMPAEKVNILLDVFSKLKQKVLWKWEDESTLPKLPPNVRTQKWMPQSDILAHKNVVLFISHGGMFGTFEGISRGVPFLFMPLYGDQYRNAKKSMKAGIADYILVSEMSSELLAKKLNKLLNDKSYRENAKRLSSVFNDNIVEPIDESMYWIEYVARHNGAPHLKSAAIHLNTFSYLGLDVLAVVIAALVMLAVVIKKIFKVVFGLCGKKTEQTKKKKQT